MRDDQLDDLVGEWPKLVGLPVVVPTVRQRCVEHLLMRDIRLLHNRVHRRRRNLTDGSEYLFTFIGRASVRGDERDDGLAVKFGGNNRERRRKPQVRHDPNFIGRVGDEFAKEP